MKSERSFRWHWTNERGPRWFPIAGRLWVYLFAWTLRLEWNLWSRACHINAEVGDASGDLDALQFSIALPPVAFWFTISAPYKARVWKFLPEPGREIEFSVHDWSLWLKLWGKWGEWNSRDPWWVRGVNLNLADLFLGDTKYQTEEIAPRQRVSIRFDGFDYEGEAKFERSTWKRPRWFAFVRESCTIDMDPGHGLPHSGKGENSWDCGDDAVCGWSVSGPADGILRRAIAKGKTLCIEKRCRYGEPSKYGPQKIEPRPDEFVGQNAVAHE